MSYQKEAKRIVLENLKALEHAFATEAMYRDLDAAAACLITCLKSGNKILLCGNGGSAADAQHIAGEFIGRFKLERKSYPAIALTTDSSVLTCVANDYSFADIFRRQVEGLGNAGDVLVAISTSGNSENVIRAVEQAKKQSVKAITFTGGKGGKLKPLGNINVNIDSDYTPYIQSGHCLAFHAVCEIVEKELAAHS